MTLILDAGAIYAQADRGDPNHKPIASLLRSSDEPLVTSAFAAALAEHLVLTRLGRKADLALLRDLSEGTITIAHLDPGELRVTHDLAKLHRGLRVGLAAVSLVLLARRNDTTRIVTCDRLTFEAVEPLQGGTFELLP